jgi:hypothetical protein
MNPLALMSYLDAQNKARQRQDEQRNQFAQQNMQQQLGLAQMGMELRDKTLAREQQQEQFALTKQQAELQKRLTEAQLAEAERNSKLGPIKDKQAFLQPLLQPHAAYTAATEAYRAYMDPSNKVKLPSKQRTLLDAVRTARSNLLASRTALSSFGKASGYTDINYDDLMKEYGVEPLPMWGFGNQTPNQNTDKVGLGPTVTNQIDPNAPLPVAGVQSPTLPTLGISPSAFNSQAQVSTNGMGGAVYPAPPPPPSIPSALFGSLAVGVPNPMVGAVKPPPKPGAVTPVKGAVPAKPVVPPIPAKPMPVIPGYNDTQAGLQKIIDKYKLAEGIAYADLDEPQQKGLADTAETMFKEVMDSFVPQTWDAKNAGREAYAKDAADFFAHGASEKMITRLLSKHAVGDTAIMKNVLLQLFANKFNEYALPPALTEKLVKGAKDALDVIDKRSEIEGQRITQAAAIQEKENKAAKHPLEMRALGAQVKGAEEDNSFATETRKTRVSLLKQQYSNAVADADESAERLKKLKRENKDANKPVKYMDVWKDTGALWKQQVADPIDKALTALEAQTNVEMRGLVNASDLPKKRDLQSRLSKLARVRGQMVHGMPQELLSKFSSNDPNAWTEMHQYKTDLLKDLTADPALADFFTPITGASSGGAPAPGN